MKEGERKKDNKEGEIGESRKQKYRYGMLKWSMDNRVKERYRDRNRNRNERKERK